MRELCFDELALVAGGDDEGDVVVTARPRGGGGTYTGTGSGPSAGSSGGAAGNKKGGSIWGKILAFFDKIGISVSINHDADVHESFLCTDANGKVAYGPNGHPYMCSYDSTSGWNVTVNGEIQN